MKYFLSLILLLIVVMPATAGQKQKQKSAGRALRCTQASWSMIDGIRKVGRVYEFTVQSKVGNILVDSVWFGNTPVPCDLLEASSRHKAEKVGKNAGYIVRANRDLYTNYADVHDSTKASQSFKPPFEFQGGAVIFYMQKGKRHYLIVREARQVDPKPLRK